MIGYQKTDQVGKPKKNQTQKNTDANAELDRIYKQKGIDYCELELVSDCLKNEKYSNGELLKLSYAHRHKRIWYKDKPTLLYSFNETVRACLPCHMHMESDRTLTNTMFTKLRGNATTRALDKEVELDE